VYVHHINVYVHHSTCICRELAIHIYICRFISERIHIYKCVSRALYIYIYMAGCTHLSHTHLARVAGCCRVLQCGAVCCSVVQCGAHASPYIYGGEDVWWTRGCLYINIYGFFRVYIYGFFRVYHTPLTHRVQMCHIYIFIYIIYVCIYIFIYIIYVLYMCETHRVHLS